MCKCIEDGVQGGCAVGAMETGTVEMFARHIQKGREALRAKQARNISREVGIIASEANKVACAAKVREDA